MRSSDYRKGYDENRISKEKRISKNYEKLYIYSFFFLKNKSIYIYIYIYIPL